MKKVLVVATLVLVASVVIMAATAYAFVHPNQLSHPDYSSGWVISRCEAQEIARQIRIVFPDAKVDFLRIREGIEVFVFPKSSSTYLRFKITLDANVSVHTAVVDRQHGEQLRREIEKILQCSEKGER